MMKTLVQLSGLFITSMLAYSVLPAMAQQWQPYYLLPKNADVPAAPRDRGDRFIVGEKQNGCRVGDRIIYSLRRPMYYDVRTGLLDTLPTPSPYSWSTFIGEFGFSTLSGSVRLSGNSVHGRAVFCLDPEFSSWTFRTDSLATVTVSHGWSHTERGDWFVPPCGGERIFLPDSVHSMIHHGVDKVNSNTLSYRFSDFALQTSDTGKTWHHVNIRGGIGLNYRFASNGILYSHNRYKRLEDASWTNVPVFRTAAGDSLGIPTGHESNIFLLWDSIPIIEIASQPKRCVYTLDRGQSWQVWESGFLPYDTTFCANGDLLFGRLHRLKKGLPLRVEKINLPISVTGVNELRPGVLIAQNGQRLYLSDDGGNTWYDHTHFHPSIPTVSNGIVEVDFRGGRKRYVMSGMLHEEDPASGRLYALRAMSRESSLYDSVWYDVNDYSTDYGATWTNSALLLPRSFTRREFRYAGPDLLILTSRDPAGGARNSLAERRTLHRFRGERLDSCSIEGFDVPFGRLDWVQMRGSDTVDVGFRGISWNLPDARGDSVVQSGGIARSVDGGLTFRRHANTHPSLTITRPVRIGSVSLAFAAYLSNPSITEFVALVNDWMELVQSTDDGSTWTSIPGTRQLSPVGGSRIVQTANGTIVAISGGNGPFYSADGGRTFAPLNVESLPLTAISNIAVFGDSVLALTALGNYCIDLSNITSVPRSGRQPSIVAQVSVVDDAVLVTTSANTSVRSVTVFDVLGRGVRLDGNNLDHRHWKSTSAIPWHSGPMFVGVETDQGRVAVRLLPH
jgi:hypothetical protein